MRTCRDRDTRAGRSVNFRGHLMTMEDELAAPSAITGRACWSGRRRAYESILACDPGNAGVWNLLGVVAHQQGDPRRAAGLMDRAVALNPRAAAFHANLAEVYRAIGQLDREVASGERAHAAGARLRGRGQQPGPGLPGTRPARRGGRAVPRRGPVRAGFRHGAQQPGDRSGRAGRQGRRPCRISPGVLADPTLAEAHSNLGQLLLEQYPARTRPSPIARRPCGSAPAFLRPGTTWATCNASLGRLDQARTSTPRP